jgi:phosphopantetheine adenylyltransferase
MASLDHIYIKSSLIKEIAAGEGNISHLVPNNVAVALRDRYRS